jgi:hypothetical protein
MPTLRRIAAALVADFEHEGAHSNSISAPRGVAADHRRVPACQNRNRLI